MSDYFFYDINKKMADLANKQQLAEDAQSAPAKPAPSALRTQLNERDMGKHNNATTGFAALAKKTGGGEKGARIAGAQLAKMRAKGQVEESTCSKCDCDPCKCDSVKESAFQAAIGKKKYGDQGMKALQKAGRDHAGAKTMSNIRNKYDKYDEGMTDEGNAFSKAVVDAKRDGIQPGEKVRVGGKQYPLREVDATPQDVESYKDPVKAANAPQRKASAPVPPKKSITDKIRDKLTAPRFPSDPRVITDKFPKPADKKDVPPKNPAMYPPQAIDDPVKEGGVPMTPKQKKFAALAKPFDKISFADKIVGAKKEVDEMLGDVAATAMKNAVGKMRGRNRDMEEASDWSKLHEPFKAGHFDDTPTRRRSSSGGEIDTSASGVTRHRPVKGNYSGAAHDAGADNEPSGAVGRRKVGAGMGKKIGAKINRGTSKLMTDEDMFEPQDSGEYDREGEMAKDDIKTVVRHAQALEKILGDEDNLPEWVQAKLAKIEGMMTAVDDYMQNQKSGDSNNSDTDDSEMAEERTSKRDNRAERAGRKVAKDIEYDEREKDDIHGKRRGSEDSRAERAGKKVTKDIEYDEKKDKKKKKEVDETTTSGSVATSSAAPKSGGGHNYGKGIYDSLNRQLENMISESMNINMSMNNDEHGGPRQSLTVTATDEDAVMLAGLLKMAGMGHGDEYIHAMTGDDSDMDALHNIDHMHGEEPCADCGQTTCECYGMMENIATNPDGTPYVTDIDPDQHDAETARLSRHNQEMDEAYGDTDASENEPDWPTDEEGTDDAMMYSGGLNGPKSTGQTTTPIIAHQNSRMGSDGDHELRRMMEIAGLR